MAVSSRLGALALTAAAAVIEAATFGMQAQAATPEGLAQETQSSERLDAKAVRLDVKAKEPLDRSGQSRVGKASFYADFFAGRKMANGRRMDPNDKNAASRTLPLGTTARVTNLKTGRSAIVTIEDRGPYVRGRIVDLSPSTAQEIGITRREGVAMVVVAPISVPLRDGRVKSGDGAVDVRLAANEPGAANEAGDPASLAF
jgi:rare lipoprotein A